LVNLSRLRMAIFTMEDVLQLSYWKPCVFFCCGKVWECQLLLGEACGDHMARNQKRTCGRALRRPLGMKRSSPL